MPRPAILITKSELQTVLEKLESESVFTNLSELCQKVCETDWAKSLKNSAGNTIQLQPQTVYQRIQTFGITVKTVKGNKGNPAIAGVKRERKPRAERMASNEAIQGAFKKLRSNTPPQYEKLISRIEGGSLKAAVRLKCLDCVCYSPKEIGENCGGCPLLPFVILSKKLD